MKIATSAMRVLGLLGVFALSGFSLAATGSAADPPTLVEDGGTQPDWNGPTTPIQWGEWQTRYLVGDVNGDGRSDGAAVAYQSGIWRIGLSTGNGFSPGTNYISGFGAPNNWASRQFLADVNGDSRADAVLYDNGTWKVALTNASGTQFGPSTSVWASNFTKQWSNQLVGDVDGDGKADAVVAVQWPNAWKVALSTGSTFAASTTWSTTLNVEDVSRTFLGDVNGDGKDDAITARNGIWRAALSTGTSFAEPINLSTTAGTTNPMLADINGDGRTDGISYENGSWSVALSSPDTTSFKPPTTWEKSFAVAGTPSSASTSQNLLLVADLDNLVSPDAVHGTADAINVSNGLWRVSRAPGILRQIKSLNWGWGIRGGDEFSGNQLDSSKWNSQRYDYWHTTGAGENGAWVGLPSPKPYSNLEEEGSQGSILERAGSVYDPSNNSVGGGYLRQELSPAGPSTPYRIGTINSLPKIRADGTYAPNSGFKFRFGYVEARVRVPLCAGCWPAFWMLPTPETLAAGQILPNFWGSPEELDIFEFDPSMNSNGWQYSNAHWSCPRANGRCDFDSEGIPRQVIKGRLTNEWHDYGFLWTPTYIQFFVDDVPGEKIYSGVPQNEMYLILTLQHFTGVATPSANQMLTDYIRVYR